jgi:prepilin-type N-terminal cleavage/methylation domain-containing protein
MQRLNSADGFTLIEVLIGLVILTIVSLALASLTISTIRGNTFSKQMTTATMLAQDKLEQVKRLGYSQVNTAVGTEAYGTIANSPAFKRVTAIAAHPPTTALTVTVTVSWAADARSVVSRTIVSQ